MAKRRDPLSKSQRSYCMSRVKQKNTAPERQVFSMLKDAGLKFRRHVKALPGCPDIVFPGHQVVVFVDGCFWHGYRFSQWEDSLPKYWREKIARNMARDRKNFRRLRRAGWRVLRLWDKQIRQDPEGTLARVQGALERSTSRSSEPS